MSAAVKNEVAFLGFRTQRLELPKAYTAFDGASITLDRIEDFCSGLLIPDTDLGENPCRERGA